MVFGREASQFFLFNQFSYVCYIISKVIVWIYLNLNYLLRASTFSELQWVRDDTNHVDQLKLFPSCAVIILFICIFFFWQVHRMQMFFLETMGKLFDTKEKKAYKYVFIYLVNCDFTYQIPIETLQSQIDSREIAF